MGTPVARPVDLHVRASRIAHLCFESGGVLGDLATELGSAAPAFDFPAFYATLGSMPFLPGHPARLIYDFLEIQSATKTFALASLRSEPQKAALSKAVNGRANAYYEKYADIPGVAARMTKDYSPSVPQSKSYRLNILASLSDQQMQELRDAYLADGRTGVVRSTNGEVDSDFSSLQGSATSGVTDDKDVEFGTDKSYIAAPQTITGVSNPGGADMQETVRMGYDTHQTQGWSRGTDTQRVTNTDYAYRVPYLENFAQYQRAQISLIDEQFSEYMDAQKLPYMVAHLLNELQMIDSDVYRQQIAYLNTILMSPIPGTVTGVYKQPGDVVQPGEPVLRVEDGGELLILTTLVYPGPIAVGKTLTVATQRFGAAGPLTTVAGPIVSARGRRQEDMWEIIARCPNLDGSGQPILPFGYHFDYDDTTLTIS